MPVLPAVLLQGYFSHTLILLRDPISRMNSAFNYLIERYQFNETKAMITCFPTLKLMLMHYTREPQGYSNCGRIAHRLLTTTVTHIGKGVCFYVGGLLVALRGVWVIQQETLFDDFKRFAERYLDTSSVPSECNKCGGKSKKPATDLFTMPADAIRVLVALTEAEYYACNKIMDISENKKGVIYKPIKEPGPRAAANGDVPVSNSFQWPIANGSISNTIHSNYL